MENNMNQKIQIPIAVIPLLVAAVLQPLVSCIGYVKVMYGETGLTAMVNYMMRLPFNPYYRTTLVLMLFNTVFLIAMCIFLVIRYNDMVLTGIIAGYSLWNIIQALWGILKALFMYGIAGLNFWGVLSNLFTAASYVVLAALAAVLLLKLNAEVENILKKIWFLPGVLYFLSMIFTMINIGFFWWIRNYFLSLVVNLIFIAGLVLLGWWLAEPAGKWQNISIGKDTISGMTDYFSAEQTKENPSEDAAEKSTSQDVSYCAGCGRKLDPEVKFCPTCGRKKE